MPPIALVVDPDAQFLPRLGNAVARAGWMAIVETTFAGARRELETKRPSAIVANIRLGMFNGVQLAYLTKLKKPSSRAILYGDGADPVLGAEAQEAHAFFERSDYVSYALTSYLQSHLPARDRRNVWRVDRRNVFRGGRRVTDQEACRLTPTAV